MTGALPEAPPGAAPPAPPSADGPILVYDGDCAFCARSVQFVLQHDRKGTLRFAARDGEAGRAVRERHPQLKTVESLLWVEMRDGRESVATYSDAVLRTARYLGGVYAVLAAVGGVVPRLLRDPAYAAVAKLRRRIFSNAAACRLPTPAELERMMP